MELLSFDNAMAKAAGYNKKNLLLGNGFSIACVPSIFTYSSLYKQADFSKMPEVKEVFRNLKTQDFEEVIHALEYAALVLPSYKNNLPRTVAKLKKHAKKIKEILIQTIAKNHPERPSSIDDSKYRACIKFLNNFLGNDGVIYTLNYDLLLYWTLMFGLNEKLLNVMPNDGFGKDVELNDAGILISVSDYVIWQGDSNAHGQNIHYLHGALHVFERDAEIEKFTWINTGKPLIEQTREALEDNRFPLFVAEGDSTKKLTRITHSSYLYHSYKSFSQRMKTGDKKSTACLFTYGVSFSANDEHIIKKIAAGKINHLFVSIYGNPDSEANKKIIQAAESIKRKRNNQNFAISYYDAESAKVWG
jgi:hypothetical protein